MIQIDNKILTYIALSIAITALVFSIYNYVLIQKFRDETNILRSLKSIDLPNITEYNPIFGNSTDIIIYEYMEYLCPACAYFNVIIYPEIEEKYINTGKISYVYKDFIIHGELANLLAAYAKCIYKEKGLEEYKNFKSETFSEIYNIALSRNYTRLEVFINKTLDKYKDLEFCVNRDEVLNLIRQETNEAIQKYRFSGTPSFLIAIKLDRLTEEKIKKIKEILEDLKSEGYSYNMWISSDRKYLVFGFSGVVSIKFFDEIFSLT